MDKLSKQDRRSLDLIEASIGQLRELFPEAFADGSVDIDVLSELLGTSVDDAEERYSFTWAGKSRARRIAHQASTATLLPVMEESSNWDTTQNAFVLGDQLQVLKVLQKSYHREAKLVFIDAPFNTGKDHLFPDDLSGSASAYEEYRRESKKADFSLTRNAAASPRFHTAWLNFMYPRLRLSRNLISEDGYCAVTIDDTELKHLRFVMDELFGESNHLATIVIDRNRKNDAKFFSVGHEYLLVYARNKTRLREMSTKLRAPKDGVQEVREIFESARRDSSDDWEIVGKRLGEHYSSMSDDDPRKSLARFNKVDEHGPYRTDGDISWPGGGGPRYDVPHPVTGKPCKVPSRGWVWPTYERMKEEIDKGYISFGRDESTIPSKRRNLFDADEQVMRSVVYRYAQKPTQEFLRMFEGKQVYRNPRDAGHARELIEYLTEPGDLVLDLFARSGSVPHAVLASNFDRGESRRFITIQLPEPMPASTAAERAGRDYMTSCGLVPDTASVAMERTRRALAQLGSDEQHGVGFRVFELGTSNFKPWSGTSENIEDALWDAVDNLRKDRTAKDLLFELLLRFGLPITTEMEERELDGAELLLAAGGTLILCVGDHITEEVVEEIANIPRKLGNSVARVVFSDSCFADDKAKLNAVQVLRQGGISDVRSI